MLRLRAAFGAAFKEVTMGHSIYLADDEKSIRELLHSFLASDGYTVRSFESGDALLEAFRQEPAELGNTGHYDARHGRTYRVPGASLCFRYSHHPAYGQGQRAGLRHGHQPGQRRLSHQALSPHHTAHEGESAAAPGGDGQGENSGGSRTSCAMGISAIPLRKTPSFAEARSWR